MSRQEVIEHIGTIAKSGTREFLQGPDRRPAQGRLPHRAVRRGLLLRVHRGRPGHADHPPGGPDRGRSRPVGVRRPGRVHPGDRGAAVPRHHGRAAPARGRGRPADRLPAAHDHQEVLRPHQPAHRDAARAREGDSSADAAAPGTVSERPVNQAAALWARPKSELTEQDYKDFYQHVTGDFTDPLAWVHSKIEGTYEYTLLLFVPSRAPFDLWMPQVGRGIKLHIRRVFVLEDSGQLMPQYLRFIRGVIDSSDLPLNVSRELLQGSRVVDNIRSNATKKVLRLLADTAEKEPEKYAAFWKEFGAVLKEGLAEDYGNRDEIARLLRFTSTKSASDEPDVSLSRLRKPDEGRPAAHLLPAGAGPGRRQGQPAPGGVPQEGHRGPAPGRRRGHRQLGGGQPARFRRQAPAVRRPGQRRPQRARGRGRSRRQGAGQRRARRAGRPAEGGPGRAGLRRPGEQPADHLASLHRGQRGRDRHQPGPSPARLRPAQPAGARDQPAAPAGAPAQPRARRPAPGRMGARPVRPGGPHPRGADDRTRRVRQPSQRPPGKPGFPRRPSADPEP